MANLMSGWLAVVLGWQSIFYVFGIIAVVWSAVWFLVVRDGPEKDPWIKQTEKEYILKSLQSLQGKKNVAKVPWKAILTSVPVYAIACAHVAFNYGYYTLLTQLPLYMRKILGFDLASSGFVSALPYIVQTFMSFSSGPLADWFLVKKILTVTQTRKYFNNTALTLQMIFLLSTTFTTNISVIVTFIVLSVSSGGIAMSGYLPNTLDIAPQFGSIILGISNTFATIPGMVSPALSGYIASTPVRKV